MLPPLSVRQRQPAHEQRQFPILFRPKQAELSAVYDGVGESIGAIVVPAGVAWQRLLDERPEIGLHDKDGSHPNFAGTFLAACVFILCCLGGGLRGWMRGIWLGWSGLGVGWPRFCRKWRGRVFERGRKEYRFIIDEFGNTRLSIAVCA